MDKELFKEMYLFELNRRDQTISTVNVLLSFLAVLGGFLGYLVQNYKIPSELVLVELCFVFTFYVMAIYHAIICICFFT